ncbi:hypothetical protein ACFE04_019543 [Oxalis oulophora]
MVFSSYKRHVITSESCMHPKIKGKCKIVIAEMVWSVLKKGHPFVPRVACMCTRAKNVLYFEKLGKKVDEDKYYKIRDVLADSILCLKMQAKSMHIQRSEIMKTQFPNVEIPKLGLPPKSSGPIFGRVMEKIGTPGPTSSSAGVRFGLDHIQYSSMLRVCHI